MTKKMKFKGYEAFKISTVYLIVELKNNCVFKTKFLGYALTKDVCQKSGMSGVSDIENISLSSMSIDFYKKDNFELDVLSLKEIENIVNNSKITHT